MATTAGTARKATMSESTSDARHDCVLIVDGSSQAPSGSVAFNNGTCSASVNQLDDVLLDKLRPSRVITALWGPGFDAMDVAEALCCAGYCGELIVMCDALPSPEIVQKEIAATAPGLRVRLSQSGTTKH